MRKAGAAIAGVTMGGGVGRGRNGGRDGNASSANSNGGGGKSGGRGKDGGGNAAGEKNGLVSAAVAAVANSRNHGRQSQSQNQTHQTPASPDEAALTAKNYRLAKELSELRVRHREECKNVTRLTMENMNLASRCREAIGQAAALKRELAVQRARANDAAALLKKHQKRERAMNIVSRNKNSNSSNNSNHNARSSSQQSTTAGAGSGAAADLSVVTQSTTMSETPDKSGSISNESTPSGTPVAAIAQATTANRKQQSTPSPTTSKATPKAAAVLKEVAAEMERMDRILAAHAVKASSSSSSPVTAKREAVSDGGNVSPTGSGSSSSSRGSPEPEAGTERKAGRVVKSRNSPSAPAPGAEKSPTAPRSADAAVRDTPPRLPPPSLSATPESSASPSPSTSPPPPTTTTTTPMKLVSSDDFEAQLDGSILDELSKSTKDESGDNGGGDDSAGSNEEEEGGDKFDSGDTEAAVVIRGKDVIGGGGFADAGKETKEADEGSPWGGSSRKAQQHQQPFFPHSASPKIAHRSYNEEYPGDINIPKHHHHHHLGKGVQPKKMDFGVGSAILMQRTGGGANADADLLDEALQQPHLAPFESLKERQDKSTLSSIDAFEASFNTSFPDSFSPKESSGASSTATSSTDPNASPTKEIYNPFSCSPAKSPSEWKDPSTDDEGLGGAASVWDGGARGAHPPAFSLSGSPASSGSAGSRGRFSGDPPGRDRTSPRPVYSLPVTRMGKAAAASGPTSKQPASASLPSNAAMNAAASAAALDSTPPSSDKVAACVNELPSPSALFHKDSSDSATGAMGRSPVPSDSSNVKLPLSSSSSSSSRASSQQHLRSSPTGSGGSSSPPAATTPSPSPTQPRKQQPSPPPTTPVVNKRELQAEGYSTPPQPSASPTSLPSTGQHEPKRPEKTGYDAARARYERALQPRSASSTSSTAAPALKECPSWDENKADESSQTANKAGVQPVSGDAEKLRSKKGSDRLSTPDKASLWKEANILSDEDEGDIPLRSSIKKKKETGETPSPESVSSAGSGGSDSMRTRQPPWEGNVVETSSASLTAIPKSNSSGSSGSSSRRIVPDADDEEDEKSNSPLARYRRVIKQQARNGIKSTAALPTSPAIAAEVNAAKKLVPSGLVGKD